MKIIEYLERLPIGEIITNKRVLSVLYRLGLIAGYSDWGYLEGKWIEGEMWEDGYRSRHLEELFPLGNAQDDSLQYQSSDFIFGVNKVGQNIEYKGFTLGSKYLDGCFKPYLYKVKGPVTGEIKGVNRTMSLGIFGGGVI